MVLASFGNDHGIDNMREHVAVKKKKKHVAGEATKSMCSKGQASKATKKVTTDDEGRKPTKCLDQALHDCVGDVGDMEDATTADCTASGPLALKLAKVYKPCALQVKKTELMEGVRNTHGIRSRRKEDNVEWLVQVMYRLEYCNHPLMSYCGVITLLKKHE